MATSIILLAAEMDRADAEAEQYAGTMRQWRVGNLRTLNRLRHQRQVARTLYFMERQRRQQAEAPHDQR